MHRSTNVSILAVITTMMAYCHAAWDPAKQFVFSGQDIETTQNADLSKDLPAHDNTSRPWNSGIMPEFCYNEARSHNLKPEDFEIRDAYYTDCAAPWTLCRHRNSTLEWKDVITVSF
jgi:hypothetical protein